MQEDTSSETATENAEAPAPNTPSSDENVEDSPAESPGDDTAEPEAEEPAPEADPAPEAESPTQAESPTPANVEGGAPSPRDPREEKLDPQLIALCVVLWLVAMGILIFQWGSMQEDWHLGNIKEALDTQRPVPQKDVEALVELGPEILPKIQEELSNPQQQDQRYRGVLLRMVVERVPGEQAFQVLLGASQDYDPRVRANAYLALGNRGLANSAEREQAFQVTMKAMSLEPEPTARAWAVDVVGKFKDPRGTWPLILVLADLDGDMFLRVRENALKGLRAVSGLDAEKLPFNVAAPLWARDEGIKRWEAWFSKNGGKIKEGEDLAARRSRQKKELWSQQQPSDKTGLEWHAWKIASTVDQEEKLPEASLQHVIEKGPKEPLKVAWLFVLLLRDRYGPRWVEVRKGCAKVLKALAKDQAGKLPLDAENPTDEQLQAWEGWYVEIGGKISRGQDLKTRRLLRDKFAPSKKGA